MVGTRRTEHSGMGVASFVLSFFPGLLFVGYILVLAAAVGRAQQQPTPPDDGAAYFLGGFLLTSAVLLAELLALGLGVAGVAQRGRKKLFAFLGIACSVLVLAFAFTQDVFRFF